MSSSDGKISIESQMNLKRVFESKCFPRTEIIIDLEIDASVGDINSTLADLE